MEEIEMTDLPAGFIIRGPAQPTANLPDGFVIRGSAPMQQQVPGIDTPQAFSEAFGDRLMASRDNLVNQFTQPFQQDKTAGNEMFQRLGDAGGRIANIAATPFVPVLDAGGAGIETQITQPIARQFVSKDTTLGQKQTLAQLAADTADLGTQALLAPTPIKENGALVLRQGLINAPAMVENKIGQIEAASHGLPGILGDVNGVAPPKPAPITASVVRQASQKAYAAAEQAGGILNPSFTDRALSILENAKQKPIAGKVLTSEDASINNALGEYADLKGQPLSLEDYQKLDSTLGNKAAEAYISGKTNQGRIIANAQDDIRDLVAPGKISQADITGSSAGLDTLNNEAIPLYAVQARLSDLEKIVNRANAMDNPSTAMRTGFRNLMLNDRKMATYPKEVRRLISKAAVTGRADDLLGIIGSRLNPIAHLATGGIAGAITSNAVSMAGRGIRNAMQNRKANNVINALTEPVRPIVQKFQNPTPAAVPAVPAQMLRLPAPSSTMTVNKYGQAVQITPATREILGNQAPTLRNVFGEASGAEKAAFNHSWNRLSQEQQANVTQQIEAMWAQNQTPLGEMIKQARTAVEELAAAKGVDVRNTAIRDAFARAVQPQ